MGRPTDPNFWQQSPPPQTGDMNNERTLNQRFMRELPGALPPQDVIIHDGAISGFASAALIVDTEGGAAADELDVINIVLTASENLHPGMIITLRAKDQARTVTVKNSAAANGINTAGGHDVVLSTEWDLVLRLVAGRWYEIQTRGDVRASAAQTDASTALARTAPATTTSRGIGRVATLADMEPGAIIENGPAFLAAGVHTSVAAAAGKIPVADGDGSMGSWANIKNAACSTAADTASKEAALSGFALVKGARVLVTFSNANIVFGALTLNVNSTGAKSIYNELGAVSTTNPATFPAGVPIEFVYDANDHWTYRKYQDEFAKVVGGAPMYACRAWAVYNGATSTILASGNISSVTRIGAGQYIFNFAQPMPDANYAISGVVNTTAGDGLARDVYITAQSANSFQAQTNDYNSSGLHDCIIEISVVR